MLIFLFIVLIDSLYDYYVTERDKKKKRIYIKFNEDTEGICKYGDWIDLKASEDVELQEGEFKIIPLGVAMKLPKGYEAHVVPRSSTFIKWGIIQTNGMGVIDSDYCGNDDMWGMPVYATRKTFIKKGDRICQFRIVKSMGSVEFIETSDLGCCNRGGFGSTDNGGINAGSKAK